MKFSEWLNKKLKEEGAGATPAPSSATMSTSVASYPRPLFMVRRGDFFPHKRKKKV